MVILTFLIMIFLFFTFYHKCPMCGKVVDDGSLEDGICFDCLEDALSDVTLEELVDCDKTPSDF